MPLTHTTHVVGTLLAALLLVALCLYLFIHFLRPSPAVFAVKLDESLAQAPLSGFTCQIRGTATLPSRISLSINNFIIREFHTAPDGMFVSSEILLLPGTNNVSVQAVATQNGYEYYAHDSMEVLVHPDPVTAPTLLKEASTFGALPIRLRDWALAGSVITVLVDGAKAATSTADEKGRFEATLDKVLPGWHSATVGAASGSATGSQSDVLGFEYKPGWMTRTMSKLMVRTSYQQLTAGYEASLPRDNSFFRFMRASKRCQIIR